MSALFTIAKTAIGRFSADRGSKRIEGGAVRGGQMTLVQAHGPNPCDPDRGSGL